MSMPQIQKNLTKINFTDRNNTSPIKFLVIHYTGNDGDSAWANTNYFKEQYRGASANYFVDENSIWQCVEDCNIAWHCGAYTYYCDARNSNAIGIEMCSEQTSNGTYYFNEATIANTVELTKYLMKKYNIPLKNVVRHWDVTRKICPAPYCNSTAGDKAWNDFKARLAAKSSVKTNCECLLRNNNWWDDQGSTSKVICSIPCNTSLSILEDDGWGWVKVSATINGKSYTGWTQTNNVTGAKLSTFKTVTVLKDDKVNFVKNSKRKGILRKGVKATLICTIRTGDYAGLAVINNGNGRNWYGHLGQGNYSVDGNVI